MNSQIIKRDMDYLKNASSSLLHKAFKYVYFHVLKKEEIFTILFIMFFFQFFYIYMTYDPNVYYYSLNTIKISMWVCLVLTFISHLSPKKVKEEDQKRPLYQSSYITSRLRESFENALKIEEQRRLAQLRFKPYVQQRSQSNNLQQRKEIVKEQVKWNPIQRDFSQFKQKHAFNDFNLIYQKENYDKNRQQRNQEQVIELYRHPKHQEVSRKSILESMSKNLHIAIEPSEIYFRQFAQRTKKYFLQTIMDKLLQRYILNLNDLIDYMYATYKICIILEDDEDLNDLIPGVQQTYQESERIKATQNIQDYKTSQIKFMTLREILKDQRFEGYFDAKHVYKGSKEDVSKLMKAMMHVENMKGLYEIFGCVTRLDLKFANKQVYVVKRLSYLIDRLDDFNYKGGSQSMDYKRRKWNTDLPSDPEIVASIFCHLLDNSYLEEKSKKELLKNPTYHLLDHTQIQYVYKIFDDQFCMINTSPVGYIPTYEYAFKNKNEKNQGPIYKVLTDDLNVFHAMTMIYSLIQQFKKGIYGNTNYQGAISYIFPQGSDYRNYL